MPPYPLLLLLLLLLLLITLLHLPPRSEQYLTIHEHDNNGDLLTGTPSFLLFLANPLPRPQFTANQIP
jgi:hypothetical protein